MQRGSSELPGWTQVGESGHVICNFVAGAGLRLQAKWVAVELHFNNAWDGQAALF